MAAQLPNWGPMTDPEKQENYIRDIILPNIIRDFNIYNLTASQRQEQIENIQTRVRRDVSPFIMPPSRAIEIAMSQIALIPPIPDQSGAGKKIKYNNKTYTIRIGQRGGKYILVGKDKKKVYI